MVDRRTCRDSSYKLLVLFDNPPPLPPLESYVAASSNRPQTMCRVSGFQTSQPIEANGWGACVRWTLLMWRSTKEIDGSNPSSFVSNDSLLGSVHGGPQTGISSRRSSGISRTFKWYPAALRIHLDHPSMPLGFLPPPWMTISIALPLDDVFPPLLLRPPCTSLAAY